MLSTYAMFKNELNIQLLSRGKVKQVYSCAIDMRFDFWQSKQSIAFSGLNFSCLYFSSQLCWKLHFNNFDFGSLDWTFLQFLLCVVAQKMLKALFVLTSICIHAHQERGPHLRNLPCMVFNKNDKVPGNIGKLSLYVIFSGFWFLITLLLIFWNFN